MKMTMKQDIRSKLKALALTLYRYGWLMLKAFERALPGVNSDGG
jgi:hypothetical protein